MHNEYYFYGERKKYFHIFLKYILFLCKADLFYSNLLLDGLLKTSPEEMRCSGRTDLPMVGDKSSELAIETNN